MKKNYWDLENRLDVIDEEIDKLYDEIRHDKIKIDSLIQKNEERKIRVSAYSAEKEKIENMLSKQCKNDYLNLLNCDIENIGLNNTVVKSPVAKCCLHNCYLSYQNVRNRKCVLKMCKNLIWLKEELF